VVAEALPDKRGGFLLRWSLKKERRTPARHPRNSQMVQRRERLWFYRSGWGRRNFFVRRSDVAAGKANESLEKGAMKWATKRPRAEKACRQRTSLGGAATLRDDCLERHEGKEARQEYYAGL
jgi:hypothetical protein